MYTKIHHSSTSVANGSLSSSFIIKPLYFCTMSKSTSNTVNNKGWKIIFHIILWSLWIGMPLFSSYDDEKRYQYHVSMLPMAIWYIAIFYFNSEILIPRVFRKKGIGPYLLSLLGLIIIATVVNHFGREFLEPAGFRKRSLSFHLYLNTFQILFITAVSTGYGFINYLLMQERQHQESNAERLRSEVSFLRSQISPHFIFNILNSIVYLIRSKSSQAEPVTIKLSELMRYMLYESNHVQVPLEKELDYLKNYVDLQRIRFEDDVKISLSIHGEDHGQIIEPMLMIPFVENAFKHGVGMIQDPEITIKVSYDAHHLQFNVKNKLSTHPQEEKDNDSGIGLRNVQRRLELLYPGRHDLKVDTNGDWYEAVLNLQLSKAE